MKVSVEEVSTQKKFSEVINKSNLTVVDFFATWCGPCMQAKPLFESLAAKYPSSNFIAVNVDNSSDISSEYGVSSLPTFMFFKKGAKLGQVVGADMNKVEEMIKKHGIASSGGFPTGGRVLGSSSSSPTTYPNLITGGGSSSWEIFNPLIRKANTIPVEQRPVYFLAGVVCVYMVLRFVLNILFK
ncbi:hypothetical protein C9374_007988 [Naegleria lovaniensis]|uniref:Thioredoxin domain-containing protein n=1 Tax=Naegleria lovaniensis TaxID=51637 RepID=A0AA88GKM5_NAELO|nr:uncharacterized protein C9374_007988 [Naegleria lovaniensis]KAG2378840.1 hypothetical protein C9374_007988 [Naegleria lovaniensis]